MQRRIAADAAGLALAVAATAAALASYCWWQATKPIRWAGELTDPYKP